MVGISVYRTDYCRKTKNNREEKTQMSKVDELIDALADHIKGRLTTSPIVDDKIAEKTRALAELVAVRAQEKRWDEMKPKEGKK